MKLKKQITEIRNMQLKQLIGWDIQKFAAGHTPYENKVIAVEVENMMDTQLEHSQFITVDYTLVETEGMTKTIRRYKAKGNVRDCNQGEGNEDKDDVVVDFDEWDYKVKCTQGRMQYYDEQAMKDSKVVDVGIQKMVANMVNDLTRKAHREWKKATLIMEYPTTGPNFDTFADALSLMTTPKNDAEGGEVNTFALINAAQKAQLRKNLKDDLVYIKDFIATGYIGTVSGVNVYTSEAVPAGEMLIARKKAVTVFVKKGVETEQERDANIRLNKVFNRRYNVVALTDENEVVYLYKAGSALTNKFAYAATGTVTDITNGVTFDSNVFTIPAGVNKFSFKDDTKLVEVVHTDRGFAVKED